MTVDIKTPFGILRCPDHTEDIKADFRDRIWPERQARVARLMDFPKLMTRRAAETVVDAAMFGIGCVEGTVRVKIQAEKDRRESASDTESNSGPV